ncbi:LTA synthase family protein [Enterococcus gilvus]|uniref:LTA synthase family protein n=1 Tax=Enterococcus gilvus TaxID=160453 RepID=UPI003EDAF5B8
MKKSRLFFLLIFIIIFWLKTLLAYYLDFSLGVKGLMQWVILWINPLATTIFLFGQSLYLKKHKNFLLALTILNIINTLILYLNIIYYREFTDFITIQSILGYSKVSEGITGSLLTLLRCHDILYWIDSILLLVIVVYQRFFKKEHYKYQTEFVNKKMALAISCSSILLFSINLSLSEANRPQLLQRIFDRNYIVKYLGLDAFTVIDGVNTAVTNNIRAKANSSELPGILKFTKDNNTPTNPQYAGIAKGKNVFIIHLESFQQFLINMKVDGQYVTPFLNSVYENKATVSFDNFFHQVGQGKTSDAENMLETSTFGLPQGSLFTQLGSANTFNAAPAVLNQTQGYSTAVFHGNVGSFWNRDHVYKNLGYQYFFDRSYFAKQDKTLGYGILDKQLFKESIEALEHIQQPFYAKFLTVTNHTPFYTDDKNFNFPKLNTGNSIVDDYVRTAHYLDQSLQEFFNYLEQTGLSKKSLFVIYGDHFGISDTNNKDLCKVFGRDPETWNGYDDAQLQRVPLMFYMPGYTKGEVLHEYGGEIDVLPTLYHLLGVDDTKYIHFGTDLFSFKHKQVVAFRNGNFVTPNYSEINGETYDKTGKKIDNKSEKLQTKIKKDSEWVKKSLSLSDKLNQENLLRFYTPNGFKPVNSNSYNYNSNFEKNKIAKIEREKGGDSTSLFSLNGNKSTENNYPTLPR